MVTDGVPATDATGAVDAVRRLAALDAAGCDAVGVRGALGLVREVQAWLALLTATLTARTAELHGQGLGGAPDPTLQRDAGLSRAEARLAVQRAAVLDRWPAFAAALAGGALAAAHVDAWGRAVERSPALGERVDQLVMAAGRLSPAEFAVHCTRVATVIEPPEDAEARFERQRRSTRLTRWIDEATGLYTLFGQFDPATGERLWTAIDRRAEALFHDRHPDTAPTDPLARAAHLDALALDSLVTAAGTGPGGRSRAHLLVLVDHRTLLDGLHEASVVDLAHGGTLPVAEVRRLACEADIIPVVLGGDGVVLEMGRARRLATPDQRRAALVMHPTCVVPSCTVPFHRTEMHHVGFWARDGGATDLGTQAPLCHGHHGDVHAGRITLRMDAVTRAVEIRARDGTVLETAPGPQGRRAAA